MKHLVLILALVASGWSQSVDSAPPEQSPLPWQPTVNGSSGSLAFSWELERTNLLSGGLTLNATYDDNALPSSPSRVGSIGGSVMPNISIAETRDKMQMSLNYSPGFALNQRLPQRSSSDHDLDFDFFYRIAERLAMHVEDSLVDTNSSFQHFDLNPTSPGGNVAQQPNNSTITPLSHQLTSISNLDVMYQVSEATTAGVSGSFNKLSFADVLEGGGSAANLMDDESWSAGAFYSYRLSPRNTLGATYTLRRISTFGDIREHATSQSVLTFYRLQLRSRMTLTFFVGPDHVSTNDRFLYLGFFPVSVNQRRWTADEGATWGWEGQRTSSQISFLHHVTDGGGLTGAVQLYSATAGLRRQLSAGWIGEAGLNYGKNDPLGFQYFGSAFWSITGTAALNRTIGEHFELGVHYGRAFQGYPGNPGPTVQALSNNHNLGWVSLGYHFAHPLGR